MVHVQQAANRRIAIALLTRATAQDTLGAGVERGSVPSACARVLYDAGFSVILCRDWEAFARAGAASQAAVAVVPSIELEKELTGAFSELWPERLACPLFLVTSDEPENLRHLASLRVANVVFPYELHRLSRFVRLAALPDGRGRLRETLRGREMHLTLKRALLWLIDKPAAESPVERGEPACLPHTAAELGRLVQLSGDYLRQLACQSGVPLGKLIRRNLALRALEMLAAGVRAEEVAARLGYDSPGGISKLIKRNFGNTAAEILADGLDEAYEDTAQLVRTSPAVVA